MAPEMAGHESQRMRKPEPCILQRAGEFVRVRPHGCFFSLTACARRGASRKRSTAMKRLVMVSLIALAVVLLLASDAR